MQTHKRRRKTSCSRAPVRVRAVRFVNVRPAELAMGEGHAEVARLLEAKEKDEV